MDGLFWRNQLVNGEIVTIVRLTGKSLDGSNAQTLRVQLIDLIKSQRSHLVIDMSRIGFLDSMGLSALISGLRACRSLNTSIKLCSLQRQSHLVFSMSGMDSAFSIFDSVEDAISQIQTDYPVAV